MEVAVIGCGVSGIQSLRQLKKQAGIKNMVAFELRDVIGGNWAYNEQTGTDDNGLTIRCNMYKDCCANAPSQAMQFWDLDYKHTAPVPGIFLGWSDILQYLNDYVDHYDLRQYIKVRTLVERVHPEVQDDGTVRWQVQVRHLGGPGADTQTHYFDSVFVCTGTFSEASMPDIAGLSSFEGLVLHSQNYRVTNPFHDKTVLLVGAGPSGVDIAIDLAECAKQVYLSNRGPYLSETTPFPDKMKLVKPIKEVRARSVVLESGDELQVDAILLCTGYKMTFPFLSEACQVEVTDQKWVIPVYKRVVHVDYPSLLFIGLADYSYCFPVIFMLAEFAVAVLMGKIALPSKEQMLEDMKEGYERTMSLGSTPNNCLNINPANIVLKPLQESMMSLAKDKDCFTPLPQLWLDHIDNIFSCFFRNPRDFRSHTYPLDIDWSNFHF